jgi:hypothetical protein
MALVEAVKVLTSVLLRSANWIGGSTSDMPMFRFSRADAQAVVA